MLVATALATALAGCGGGGGGGGGGGSDSDSGTPPGSSDGGTAQPGPSASRSCQSDFSTQRVDSGEDCAPRYFEQCPRSEPDQLGFGFTSVPACDGVDVQVVSKSDVENSFSGTLDYIVLRPANRAPSSVLVSLHFRQLGRDPQTAAATYAALMRKSELVKARNVMVILPGSPTGNWPQSTVTDNTNDLLAGLPLNDALAQLGLISDENELLVAAEEAGLPASGLGALFDSLNGETLSGLVSSLSLDFASVEDNLDYIELAMFDAFAEFGGESLPRYVSGLSNGGIYAARFACRRPELFKAALVVAGSIGPAESEACMNGAPVGTVQVHGTVDVLAPYGGGLTYPVRGGGGPGVLSGLLSPGSLDPLGLGLPTDVAPESFEDPQVADIADSFESEQNQSLLDDLFALSALVPVLGSDEGLFLDVFAPNNGCSGSLQETVVSRDTVEGDSAGDVIIEQFPQCENPGGFRSFLVTVNDGGHHWPGYDDQSDLDFNAFGPISRDFDATIQGFDLLERAAGQR
ncbi:hypothetical protein [Algiphilus sp.]|uniref:hypothetical protein n=1 Tax=Algiphilus sp. TaxID=1872431 RepID=UPI003B528E0D